MMYGEPGDIWIFQVATLNRITNPEHVHSEAHASTERCLLHKPGLLALFSVARALGHQERSLGKCSHRQRVLYVHKAKTSLVEACFQA